MSRKIIVLGYSKEHDAFQSNFDYCSMFADNFFNIYPHEDFMRLKLDDHQLVDIWFAGIFASICKPYQDIYYQDADVLIAFGDLDSNIVKYVNQMKRVYCPCALAIYPNLNPILPILVNPIFTGILGIDIFRTPQMQREFKKFFSILLEATKDNKHLQLILKPETTSEMIYSKAVEIASMAIFGASKLRDYAKDKLNEGLSLSLNVTLEEYKKIIQARERERNNKIMEDQVGKRENSEGNIKRIEAGGSRMASIFWDAPEDSSSSSGSSVTLLKD